MGKSIRSIKTLVLHATNVSTAKRILAVSVFSGIFGVDGSSSFVSNLGQGLYATKLKSLLSEDYIALGYMYDWLAAVVNSPELDVNLCNVNNAIEIYKHCYRNIKSYDFILIMHSAAGDSMILLNKLTKQLQKRSGKLAVFIGNEYDLLEEKRVFLQESAADYILSQLPIEAANFIYEGIGKAKVIEMPHALNPNRYNLPSAEPRIIDIGFVGAKYPIWIGDEVRNNFISLIESKAKQLKLNTFISVGNNNLPADQWANILSRSKLTCGAEAGSSYLDKHGYLIARAKLFLLENPDVSLSDLLHHCFNQVTVAYCSGKAISSRHFEPIGTKTCQILVNGKYNGILLPDIHFLSVQENLSNLDEKIREGLDDERRNEISDKAYEFVLNNHTYDKRIQTLVKNIFTAQ
jgi:hypothetical protein